MKVYLKKTKKSIPTGTRWDTYNIMFDETAAKIERRTGAKLRPLDYAVWSVLFRHASQRMLVVCDGEKKTEQVGCYAQISTQRIAESIGAGRDAVFRSLKKLQKVETIEIAVPKAKSRSTIYRVWHLKKTPKTTNS